MSCSSHAALPCAQAAATIAAIDANVDHQKVLIDAGVIPPLVAMLKGGSAAAQASAARGLANAAAYDKVHGQNAIASAGAVPILLNLLESGKAQMPAAHALANLAKNNSEIQVDITSAGGIAPLLSLLNGRNTDAQVQAAAALSELARDNIDTQAAVAKAGGIGPLLSLVTSRNPAAQAHGMGALAQLAHHNRENQDTIARMGGLRAIVNLLDLNGDRNVQAHAACALMEISRANPPIQTSIVDNGGISQLAALIKNSTNAAVKAQVAGALWSLSADPKIKISIAGASCVPPLVSLLGQGDDLAVMHSAKALASIGFDNDNNQVQITQLLIELLSQGTPEGKGRAVLSLQTLREENSTSHHNIAEAGDPEALVDLLKAGIPEAKDFALWSLSLSIRSSNQGVVAQAGGTPPLIAQLSDHRVHIREQAAAALAKLANNNNDTRSLIATEGGVKPLISLLDTSGSTSELVRQNAAAALADLAVDSTARDEIVGMGGIRPLVLLLEDEGRNTKKFAAMALARLSKDHEATQSAIAEAGAIAPLVALLDGKEGPEAQEEAAGALFALADHERNRLGITEADGIGWLVMLLGSDNPRSREHAEGALVRLSIESTNRVQIIKKLVDMLQDSGNSAQEQSAAALANLARESEDNRKSIVDANGIPPLLALLESSSAKAKENSVGALKQLCRKSKENQSQIAKAGGIPKLVGVLLGFSGATMKDTSIVQLCTLAAEAIKEMAKGNRKNQDAIADSGAIAPLVAMLGSPSAQMQANAAGALANLARNNQVNQAAIAKTGAVAPLCTLVREGSAETKDQSASALWSLSTDNAPNKDTIAKLGGIDPLVGLLITGDSQKSQECIAGGLAALAFKHSDNRQLIAKRLVGLLGSSSAKAADKATRVLMTCSSFTSDHPANQVAIAKGGGIPPLITWLGNSSVKAQAQAAHAMFCLAHENNTTQQLVAKSDAIPPLITLMRRSSPAAQEHATRCVWHLATQAENQSLIVDAGAYKPMVSMLAADGNILPELSAFLMVRLAQGSSDVSVGIAETRGVVPLVKLLSHESPGAQQQAAAALAEIALVSKNRDIIASAGGIDPLVKLLDASTVGTPETSARALAHISREDEAAGKELYDDDDNSEAARQYRKRRKALYEDINPDDMIKGSAARRAKINSVGGVRRLISMVDASNLFDSSAKDRSSGIKRRKVWSVPKKVIDEKDKGGTPPPAESVMRVAMQEQSSAALADLAHDNHDMQDAIIEAGGVPPLLAFIRSGTLVGQEHAARAIWHLAEQIDNQQVHVDSNAIPDLVMLLKSGSPKAQEYSAAGISDLARGAIVEWIRQQEGFAAVGKRNALASKGFKEEAAKYAEIMAVAAAAAAAAEAANPLTEKEKKAKQKKEDEEDHSSERLMAIADAGGITPLVALLSTGTVQARENASGALWRLALETSNQMQIAKVNGIAPLVTVLDDGTPQAHIFAADALARLAINNPENQAQIAKHLVGMLGNPSAGAQRRAAHAVADLADNNPGSPGIIVNAGAISPLVNLVSLGVTQVKVEAAGALSMLAMNSPANQLAIASGLVALLGTGTAEAQEQVTKLLLTLSNDADNRVAIAKAGSIQRLVTQLRGGGQTSTKAQELAAAVLARLSGDSDENVAAIASASGIRPLVALLTSDSASGQAHSATVLADMARKSKRNRNMILNEGASTPLIGLLSNNNNQNGKAEAAGALLSLCNKHPETQRRIAEEGAIKPLVALLGEEHKLTCKKAAGAIAALSFDFPENQDAVEKFQGVGMLVGLLKPSISDEVRAEAAAALAVLAQDNKKNQDKVAADGGIEPLVALLREETSEKAKEEASAALWSLAAKHYENQVAVANADGIAPLVAVLGLGSARAQEQAAGALAALALDNSQNEVTTATLIVSLLGSNDKGASAKAARAISRLARAHASNQTAIAVAGGVKLLVNLLDTKEGGVGGGDPDQVSETSLVLAKMQKEIASAIWSMADNNPENQIAIAQAGGIPPLIALLEGHPEVHRDVAGALWSLAKDSDNQRAIADEGGIVPLVGLLKTGSQDAQETVAGSLFALAETSENRVSIAAAGGIPPLVDLFDGGTDEAKEQAAGALQTLVINNMPNQLAVAQDLVRMIKEGSLLAQEHVTTLFHGLARDPDNRGAIAKAGAVPELVRQLEGGTEKSMEMAASGLMLVAMKSQDIEASITQELVKLLASTEEAVRQRASEALRGVADKDKTSSSNKKAQAVGTGGGAPLVNLLKDGLKDGRVEAQEYALWSLSSITDTPSKEAVVQAGAIRPLIAALVGGKISPTAQEHAAAVLSGLAPIGDNAKSIAAAKGIEPLVMLLIEGTSAAKEHAAAALAQLALRAAAALEIAKAGAISAFVEWLVDPTRGPPGVAARALSEIALDNADTQSQIAEEGAIPPLVAMVAAGARSVLTTSGRPSSAASTSLKLANSAAGALATLSKNNIFIQVTITEEDGIAPLVELLKGKAKLAYENTTKALWHLAEYEENQTAIALAGGLAPLVELLASPEPITQQFTAAALESLAREHIDNQIALAKAGAIAPLVELLGSDSTATQEHAVGALLHLASKDESSRNEVIKRLVAVLDMRNAAAQMKSAEALAVLAGRSSENRKAITVADAIPPLIRLMGDGRRVRTDTPQERAAAVLADLARSGENKETIVEERGVPPLVAMLSSESPEAQTHAAGALWHLALLVNNRLVIAKAGGIRPLVTLLGSKAAKAQTCSAGALFHLASSGENRKEMISAGAIPRLVKLIGSKQADTREHAAAVLSTLAVQQGKIKKMIVASGGIVPLIALLSDPRVMTQRHAACSLWGLAEGPDGIYDKQIAENNAIQPLLNLLQHNHHETCGFAAACLMCLCRDPPARQTMIELGAAEPLLDIAHGPANWLRSQAVEMLNLLGISIGDADFEAPPPWAARLFQKESDGSPDRGRLQRRSISPQAQRGGAEAVPKSIMTRQKYHFFSFQTGNYNGFKDEYWPGSLHC